jgi:hypothetical protein
MPPTDQTVIPDNTDSPWYEGLSFYLIVGLFFFILGLLGS